MKGGSKGRKYEGREYEGREQGEGGSRQQSECYFLKPL